MPEHSLDQENVKRSLRPLLPLPPRRLDAVMALFDNALVERRFSVLPLEQLTVPRSLSETMALYRESAVRLGRTVAADCLSGASLSARAVDLVITLSCTGFIIPSLDAYLAQDLNFRPDVRRLPITELGCVAGAAALGRAHDFLLGHPDAHVLIVAIELPTLSFQRDDSSMAQLVSTALFGDGAAAVLLTGRRSEPGVALLDAETHLFPNSLDLLGFDLRDDGLHVVLAKELPETLRATFGAVVDRLLARAGIGRADLECCAFHPGGKRILVAIEEALGLDRTRTQPSWDVLREYGNLSSVAVLLHVGILAGAGVEAWITRRAPVRGLAWAMLALLLAANALHWWVIATLGPHWNVAIMDSIVEGNSRSGGQVAVCRGPFRWIRHPNYVAVFIELLALPLVHAAWLCAAVGSAAHIWVLRHRVHAEEAVLLGHPSYQACDGG